MKPQTSLDPKSGNRNPKAPFWNGHAPGKGIEEHGAAKQVGQRAGGWLEASHRQCLIVVQLRRLGGREDGSLKCLKTQQRNSAYRKLGSFQM